MTTESEPPITLAELVELNELEREARGVTADDITRSTRARLAQLREGKGRAKPHQVPLETRIATLEDEVKRLRELIENGRNNG
jgi:hypothetical protein